MEMQAIFQRKGKKGQQRLKVSKNGQKFENLGKMYKIRKYFEKGQVIACNEILEKALLMKKRLPIVFLYF